MTKVELQFIGCGDAFGTGGRFNTCFHVTSKDHSFLIDCGASSLVGLKKQGIDPNHIDAIFLSHLHGDHFGGVVFFLMDARYVAGRTKPLLIAGPKNVKARVIEAMNALYPGCWDKGIDFDVEFVELEKGYRQEFNGVGVHPFNAQHLQDGNDFVLRFDVEGKIITYSGDTGWTDDLVPAAENADLFICEAFHYDSECPFHLDYQTLETRQSELKSKRLILTHLGPDALKKQSAMTLETAHDGLKVEV